MKAVSPSPLRGVRGFSLVELMVSITVALFLIGGVLTVVQHTRNTFKIQNQMAQLQDSERIAMTLIAGVIQSAGYYPDPHTNSAATALPITTTGFATNGSFATIVTPTILGTNSATAPNDTITVRYAVKPGDNAYNCMGGTNPATGTLETWENTFRINSSNQLECSLWSTNTGAATTVPLVNDVTNLQITYGVNTKGGSSATNSCVDTYIPSASMGGPSSTNWSNICTVTVTLTFKNPAAPPGGPQTVQFTRVIAVMNMVGVNL